MIFSICTLDILWLCSYIGVDINPECKKFEKDGVRVIIGDQSEVKFWAEFKVKVPEGVDIFLDDSGHTMKQQIVTLEEIFWQVRDGGIFLCEDLHTSYWADLGGGYLRNGTMVERSKALVETLTSWHSQDNQLQVSRTCTHTESPLF
jgi:hypothetical protein